MTIIKEMFRIAVLNFVTSLVLEYQCRFDFVAGSFFVLFFTLTGDISGTEGPYEVW